MILSRTARALAAAFLLSVAATAGCSSLDGGLDNLVASSPSPSLETYPARVTGPGTRMSNAGCEQYADAKTKPIECQKLPRKTAYLSLKTPDGSYGSDEYVPVDQFQASCTRETTTVTGPDDLTVVFARGARTVQVSHAGTAVGTYTDQYLWWVRHTSVSTNGTSKVGDGELTISMRVTCDEPVPTPSADPDATA